jgi:dTDP-4-dehydrorhamnose reductase
MRILVTGRDGQVGKALVEALDGDEIVATTRAELDLGRPDEVAASVRALAPDLIVNAAAYTDVERAESEPALAHAVNAHSVAALAEVARERDIALVHYSTDYVFDGAGQSPYAEDHPAGPLSVYGQSKWAGEQHIRASGCAHLIVRTSWVYAAWGRNFVRTMLQLAQTRDELRIVADQYGAPTHARFIAQVTARLLRATRTDAAAAARIRRGETLHVANGGCTTWFGFAQAIFESEAAAGNARVPRLTAIGTADFPTRARRPLNSRLDLRRLSDVWRIDVQAWRSGLEECLHELRASAAGA